MFRFPKLRTQLGRNGGVQTSAQAAKQPDFVRQHQLIRDGFPTTVAFSHTRNENPVFGAPQVVQVLVQGKQSATFKVFADERGGITALRIAGRDPRKETHFDIDLYKGPTEFDSSRLAQPGIAKGANSPSAGVHALEIFGERPKDGQIGIITSRIDGKVARQTFTPNESEGFARLFKMADDLVTQGRGQSPEGWFDTAIGARNLAIATLKGSKAWSPT